VERGFGSIEQLSDECGGDATTAGRWKNIQVPQPSDSISVRIRITIQATYSKDIISNESADKQFTRLIEPICSRQPFVDQPIYEAETFARRSHA
jgi:hypothetical protein